MNYSVRFDPKFGYYRARAWDRTTGADTYAKVPDKYWLELGLETPSKPDPKHEKLALKWAASWCNEVEAAAKNEHTGRRDRKMNLREAFGLYCERRALKLSDETIKRDRISFNAIARHVDVDSMTPERVDEPIIDRFAEERADDIITVRSGKGGQVRKELGRTVRNRTINNEIDLIQRLVKFSWKWKSETGMAALQLDEIERLPAQDSLQVALTEEAVGGILRKIDDDYRRNMIIFGITSRLREDNLLGLRGEWINWPESWLHIPAEFMKKGRRSTPSALSIPLPAIALEQLGDARLKGYIWANPETGRPYTKISGIEKLGISEHDLRTTGNTWLYNHGVDHLVRKALMGHSLRTGDVTDLYTKVMNERMREAVAIYDEIFKRIMKPDVKVLPFAERA